MLLCAGVIAALFAIAYGVTVNVDSSQATDLTDFGKKVKATMEDYYPKVVQILNSTTFQPVDTIPLCFNSTYNGIAYAQGVKVTGSVKYYRAHSDDIGSMIHELAHVVQQYKSCAGWVTEGIADWVRYWHYEPAKKPGKPAAGSNYTQGYGVAAYFLDWMNARYNPMIYYLNKDCREGTYKNTIFPRLTNKTADRLWQDMMSGK